MFLNEIYQVVFLQYLYFNAYIYMYICVYVCMYVYVYMYIMIYAPLMYLDLYSLKNSWESPHASHRRTRYGVSVIEWVQELTEVFSL